MFPELLQPREANTTYCTLNKTQELLGRAEVNDFGPRNHLFHLIKNEEIFFCQRIFVGDHGFKRIKNAGVDRSDTSMERFKANVPHPDNVLLVLRPIFELWWR